jgi:membrane fusion protein (multidrug efflux system)
MVNFKNTLPVIFLLLFSMSCSNNDDEKDDLGIPLPVTTLKQQNATTSYQYLGAIEGVINVEVRPQVEGILEEIYIDEGAFVDELQPLFKINTQPYVEQLNNAKANVELESARLRNAQIEIDRLKPLVENEVIADVKLRTAESNYEIAKAALQQSRALQATAKINLDFTIIKAPVSGYISRIPKQKGNLVSKGDDQPLTVLSDIHQVYVYFSLSESDYLFYEKMKSDTTARRLSPNVKLIMADGKEYQHKGIVDADIGQVDRSTGSITLRAKFSNPDRLLRSGNTGKIVMEQIHPNVILIPQVATISIQDKTFIFALTKANIAQRREITIEGKSGENYIVSGKNIKAADRIVLSGFDRITEGVKVNPVPEGKLLDDKTLPDAK